ncbi:hypothetical protein BDR26DRAFT_953004 [Obelidium mucronatum]|nr:hypothetical protein BDR26DRAFT_953004 [Obelidium mucronatum]
MIAANTKWFDSFNGIGVRNWSKTIRQQYTAVKLNGVSSPSANDVVDNIVEECFLQAPEVKAVKKFVADQRALDANKPSFNEFLEFMLKSFKTGDVFAKTGDLDKIVGRYSAVPAGHYSWRSLTQLITEKNEELQRPLPELELVVYVKDALLQRNMLDAVLQNAAEERRDTFSKEYSAWVGKEMVTAGSGGGMPTMVSEEYSMELAAAILKYVSDCQGVTVGMTAAETPRSSGIAAAAAGLVPLPPSMNSSRRESLASSNGTAVDSDILRELRKIRQMFNAPGSKGFFGARKHFRFQFYRKCRFPGSSSPHSFGIRGDAGSIPNLGSMFLLWSLRTHQDEMPLPLEGHPCSSKVYNVVIKDGVREFGGLLRGAKGGARHNVIQAGSDPEWLKLSTEAAVKAANMSLLEVDTNSFEVATGLRRVAFQEPETIQQKAKEAVMEGETSLGAILGVSALSKGRSKPVDVYLGVPELKPEDVSKEEAELAVAAMRVEWKGKSVPVDAVLDRLRVSAKAAKIRMQPLRKVVVDWPPGSGIEVVKPRESAAPYQVPERKDPHAPKRSVAPAAAPVATAVSEPSKPGDAPSRAPLESAGSANSSPAELKEMEIDAPVDATEGEMSKSKLKRLKRKEKKVGFEEKEGGASVDGKSVEGVDKGGAKGKGPVSKRVSGVSTGKAAETAMARTILGLPAPQMTIGDVFDLSPAVARAFVELVRVREVPVVELDKRAEVVAAKMMGGDVGVSSLSVESVGVEEGDLEVETAMFVLDLNDVMHQHQEVDIAAVGAPHAVVAVPRCKVIAVCPRFKSLTVCGKLRVYNVLIDSGSQISGMRHGLYLSVADECPLVASAQVNTCSAHNDVQKLKGLTYVPCDIYSIKATLPFFLVRDEVCPYNILLGQNVIDHLKMKFDHDEDGNYWALLTHPATGEEVRVMVTNADHYDNQYDLTGLTRA